LVPGKHGLHIHEAAICEGPDFKTAGAHFNPTNKKHGFENTKGPHAGDLPNLSVSTEGTVTADMVAKNVTLEEGKPNSLLKPGGTSLIIHSGPDDYHTDPAGNSGSRVACGKIQ
jgi:superoxide dismutase, Cu-Zn family